jgi:hypothetical protein
MNVVLYYSHYTWCEGIQEEISHGKKTLTLMWKKFQYQAWYYVSFVLLFNCLNYLISPDTETHTEPQKERVSKTYIILYCHFIRFQTLVILHQPKTGFNSIRFVLNISTKWQQHMWLTLLRGHASLNVEWILSHQNAEQPLLPKPRNTVS